MTKTLGSPLCWGPNGAPYTFRPDEIGAIARQFRKPTYVITGDSGHVGVGLEGSVTPANGNQAHTFALSAALGPVFPEWLGDRTFLDAHNVRFPYIAGAMANGIASARLVTAMAQAGMLAFFGAAGLGLQRVERAIDVLTETLGDRFSWGANLIHSPNEPALEDAVADLYLRRGVRRVSAAAYLKLTPALVRYACTGLSTSPDGQIARQNHVFAKVSHPEVARHFLASAPQSMLDALVAQGKLTLVEAQLALRVPIAEDITAESDSGGHTDNRPLTALLPSLVALRDEMVRAHGYQRPVRVGAAGGLGTPTAVAAAFSLGGAYVLTGSVNQACVESGLDESGRKMLAQADLSDVVMAPAADMFEQGVEVQVLQRGTMFANRAKKLYELFRKHESLETILGSERETVEKQILRATFSEAWASTRDYWIAREPKEVERAEREPKHKMALVFRAYLGQASRWAIQGQTDRRIDFQIWCGPAMGAFNRWVKGTFLDEPKNRSVVQVALNLLEGAAYVTRIQQLRSHGVPVPTSAFGFRPRPLLPERSHD